MRHQIALASLLVIVLTMAGCGTDRPNRIISVNGTWFATLNNADGSPAYAFAATFNEASNGTLSVSGLTFQSTGNCGALSQVGATGSVHQKSVLMTISTLLAQPQPESTTLTLNGTVAGGIRGTWTLAGATALCSGSGTFTMSLPNAGG